MNATIFDGFSWTYFSLFVLINCSTAKSMISWNYTAHASVFLLIHSALTSFYRLNRSCLKDKPSLRISQSLLFSALFSLLSWRLMKSFSLNQFLLDITSRCANDFFLQLFFSEFQMERRKIESSVCVCFFSSCIRMCGCAECRIKMRFRHKLHFAFISIISTSKCLPPNHLIRVHNAFFLQLCVTWCFTI